MRIVRSIITNCDSGKVMFSVACVCLCVCPAVRALTFERLDLRASFFGILVHLHNIQVKLVYKGYRVKVKVNFEVNIKD